MGFFKIKKQRISSRRPKLFSQASRELSNAEVIADNVEQLRDKYSAYTDEQLRECTNEFIKKLQAGLGTDLIQAEAYAVVREMAFRKTSMLAYRVQLVGASVVNSGNFAEMVTGEGKTLTIVFPIYLNALIKKGVHVISVNEYLVERDADFCRSILEPLGISVGHVLASMNEMQKRNMYACDVTYISNSEVGFDYLRDNMSRDARQKVQRGLSFAIIDEGDSVLIDEARTPLIISGGSNVSGDLYINIDRLVKSFDPNNYVIERESRTVSLSKNGIEYVQKTLNIKNLYDISNSDLVLRINNALMANYVFSEGKEYILKDGEILLVDHSTGRIMKGRSYSNGLQQAIQAKHGVEIEAENSTIATITYQSFFRLYEKIAAVSGTAMTEAEEFLKIYNLAVVPVPTNKHVKRIDHLDRTFSKKSQKWKAVVEEIKRRNEKEQPVLVGTASVEDSEMLSNMLFDQGINHEVLNAKNNEREAEIIANAGKKKSVTISTNMAGRGTDIKLGEGVIELGGLFVLGTERHESRRIDNQLRGRSGRQGDPGESQFFVSLQDELFKRFGKQKTFEKSDDLDDESLTFTKLVTIAQKRIENLNFDTRKHLMDYDHVLASQRELIYKQRDKILSLNDNLNIFNNMAKNVVKDVIELFDNSGTGQGIDFLKLSYAFNMRLLFEDILKPSDIEGKSREDISSILLQLLQTKLKQNSPDAPDEILQIVFRDISISIIDQFWKVHIDRVLKLREGVQLRSLEQVNPLNIYINDSDKMFTTMIKNVAHQSVIRMMTVKLRPEPNQPPVEKVQMPNTVKEVNEQFEKSGNSSKREIEKTDDSIKQHFNSEEAKNE